mgnify:CR=1 FL=1
MVTSKFRAWALLSISLLLGVTAIFPLSASMLWEKVTAFPVGVVAFLFFLGVVWVWLLWGELRTKLITATLGQFQIAVKGFAGLGPEKIYPWRDLEGYKIAILPSEHGTYEYLYLFREGKKVVKLSEFYHQNYQELKNTIRQHCQDLGSESFSFWKEIKEIFQ